MSQRLIFFIFFLFLFYCRPVFAAVIINEIQIEPISDQWVELYNNSSEEIDISGWIIDDSGGSEKYVIDLNTTIATSSFKLFGGGKFNFNKSSSDIVQLFDINNKLIDSYSYDVGPGIDHTYGRYPDASGPWGICMPTPESNNNCFFPTPTYTITPTPTKNSSPTPTLKPINSPTATTSPIPVSITSNPVPKPTISELNTNILSTIENDQIEFPILGIATPTAQLSSSPTPSLITVTPVIISSKSIFPIVGIGIAGIFFLAAGIIFKYTSTQDGNKNNQQRSTPNTKISL